MCSNFYKIIHSYNIIREFIMSRLSNYPQNKSHKKLIILFTLLIIAILAGISLIEIKRKKQKQITINRYVVKAKNLLSSFSATPASKIKAQRLSGKVLYEKRKNATETYMKISLLLEKALTLNPKNQNIKNTLYQIYKEIAFLGIDSGDYILSHIAFQRCKLLDPSSEGQRVVKSWESEIAKRRLIQQKRRARYFYFLAMKSIEKEDREEAINCLKKVLYINPSHYKAHNEIGKVYQSKNELVLALKHYKKAIKLNPKDPEVQCNIGVIYSRKGDLKKSKEHFDKAIKLDRKYVIAYNDRGNINRDMGNIKAAFKDYSKAMKLDPKYPWAYYNRAMIYTKLKMPKRADEDFKKFVKLAPETPQAKKIKKYLKKKFQRN